MKTENIIAKQIVDFLQSTSPDIFDKLPIEDWFTVSEVMAEVFIRTTSLENRIQKRNLN